LIHINRATNQLCITLLVENEEADYERKIRSIITAIEPAYRHLAQRGVRGRSSRIAIAAQAGSGEDESEIRGLSSYAEG
jgi:hypothetical protein